MYKAIFFACCCLLFPLVKPLAATLVNYTPLEDPSDHRLDYPIALITLAMEKTRNTYGDFQLGEIPRQLTLARSLFELKRDTYPNYFILGGVNFDEMKDEQLIYVDFPVDQGLLSYRICFVSPAAEKNVSDVKNIAQLKRFSIGQGSNWPDVPILRSNGFNVIEIGIYTSLFKMVAAGRIDLFCRGINELKSEYENYKNIGSLHYDTSFSLFYLMPYRYYFNKNSLPLVRRLEEGFKIAHADGSLRELFIKYNYHHIQFSQLKKRKVFILQSPFSDTMSATYKSYMIDPLTLE